RAGCAASAAMVCIGGEIHTSTIANRRFVVRTDTTPAVAARPLRALVPAAAAVAHVAGGIDALLAPGRGGRPIRARLRIAIRVRNRLATTELRGRTIPIVAQPRAVAEAHALARVLITNARPIVTRPAAEPSALFAHTCVGEHLP